MTTFTVFSPVFGVDTFSLANFWTLLTNSDPYDFSVVGLFQIDPLPTFPLSDICVRKLIPQVPDDLPDRSLERIFKG